MTGDQSRKVLFQTVKLSANKAINISKICDTKTEDTV